MRALGSTRQDPQTLPLRWLFLDLNSYFASVEQAEDPSLRGRPVAVVPTPGDGATIIAASYEAKAFGVKTLTKVGDARRMCPGIVFVDARHTLYVHYHNRIVEAAESVLPVDKVCSIDEMRFRLLGEETTPEGARQVGLTLKSTIAATVSPVMTSSIGVATNAYLAKVGTELQKPNGLVVIQASDLPEKLLSLKLRDFPGINRKMEARLMGAGIFSTADLAAAPITTLQLAFGRTMAERWWHLLRGYDLDFQAESNKSLGRSHVLSPDMRDDPGVRAVMIRLICKATSRLRSAGLWAQRVSFAVNQADGIWHHESGLPPTQDAITVMERLTPAWDGQKFTKPVKASVHFTNLKKAEAVTASLFEETGHRAKLGEALDGLNSKFGKHSVFVASVERAKDHASEKIAFNKVSLLSEGRGDNVWKTEDQKEEDSEKPAS